MNVRYTTFLGPDPKRTVTLQSDDPYATSGADRGAHGWTYYEYEAVTPKHSSPYTVVSVHHDVTGQVIGVYEWATERRRTAADYPALADVLKLD
ncbi:hypothetical protein [Streptomyces misionensis]|uniref:hypothetical protein n=1 Tax=Streptomyces misionensis TaxID=67331 RepID=UPI0036928D3B